MIPFCSLLLSSWVRIASAGISAPRLPVDMAVFEIDRVTDNLGLRGRTLVEHVSGNARFECGQKRKFTASICKWRIEKSGSSKRP